MPQRHIIIGEPVVAGSEMRTAVVVDENGKASPVCMVPSDAKDVPPGGEPVDLIPCPDPRHNGRMFHIHSPGSGHKGPARVATPAYCEGYERIFGKAKEEEGLPN